MPLTGKAAMLNSDGDYTKIDRRGKKLFIAQDYFCEEAAKESLSAKDEVSKSNRTFTPEIHK